MAAGLVLFCAVAYPFLPGRIPVHMDVAGRPDGYGPKIVLWGIVGCAIGLYAFLTYPGSWSRWGGGGADTSWKTPSRLLRILKAACLLAITFTVAAIIVIALTGR